MCIEENLILRNSYPYLMLAILLLITGVVKGEDNEHRFQLKSAANNCEYEIEVVIPAGASSSDTKYPVVYCMDWFILDDYYKALPKMMALGRLVEPHILVGISQGETFGDWATMRTRDYTPAQPTDDYTKSCVYPDAIESAGGADKFSSFLKNELVPRIESEFPADSTRRCFAGYSFGSLLGVYLLENDPQLFHYYLLGSPSLWYNEYYLADELANIPSDKLESIERIYLSVGEEESWEMLKSYDLLRSALHKMGLKDKRLKLEIISSSSHVSAMPISLYNGLRFILGTKDN